MNKEVKSGQIWKRNSDNYPVEIKLVEIGNSYTEIVHYEVTPTATRKALMEDFLKLFSPYEGETKENKEGLFPVAALIDGKKIRREAWSEDGLDHFVVLMEGDRFWNREAAPIDGKKVNERTAKIIGENRDLSLAPYLAHFSFYKDVRKGYVMTSGWTPTTEDLLADDWETIE